MTRRRRRTKREPSKRELFASIAKKFAPLLRQDALQEMMDLAGDPPPDEKLVDSASGASVSSTTTDSKPTGTTTDSKPTGNASPRGHLDAQNDDGSGVRPAVVEKPMSKKKDTSVNDARQRQPIKVVKVSKQDLSKLPGGHLYKSVKNSDKPLYSGTEAEMLAQQKRDQEAAQLAAEEAEQAREAAEAARIAAKAAADAEWGEAVAELIEIQKEVGVPTPAERRAAAAAAAEEEKQAARARLTPEERAKLSPEERAKLDLEDVVEPPTIESHPLGSKFDVVSSFQHTAAYARSKIDPEIASSAIIGLAAFRSQEEPETAWAWEGVATDKHHVEISGPTTSGKTTFLAMLAVASVTFGPPRQVLGRTVTPIPLGKFGLFIEEENSRDDLQELLEDACEMLDVDPRCLSRLIVLCRTGFTPGSERAQAIFRDARKGMWGRIFLDSRARIFPGQANAEDDQAASARWITNLINQAGCSTWVVSHTRKGLGSELDDVSGNQQRVAAADVVILVRAKTNKKGQVESSRITFKKIRKGLRLGQKYPCPVRLTIRLDADGRQRCSHVEIRDAEETGGGEADKSTSQSSRDQLLDLIREETEVSLHMAREKLRVGPKQLEAVVDALVEEKLVVKFRKDINGRRSTLLRLRGRYDGDFDEMVPKPKPRSDDSDD